jgi:arylformamidase
MAKMKQRKIYDVSLTMRSGMPVYPGDTAVNKEALHSMARGDSYNTSALSMGTHSGTHVDAPRHFIADGLTVDQVPSKVLVGTARLFQLSDVKRIDRAVMAALDLTGVSRLLIGTGNSELLKKDKFDPDYAFITGSAAQYIVDAGIRLLGFDYLSIEDFNARDCPAHHILLGTGVVIVEGLYLAGVPAGDYELFCLPIKIENSDGAPARVFLREMR